MCVPPTLAINDCLIIALSAKGVGHGKNGGSTQ
jgi:hypothetical protein